MCGQIDERRPAYQDQIVDYPLGATKGIYVFLPGCLRISPQEKKHPSRRMENRSGRM
jgi:hypothetical protein